MNHEDRTRGQLTSELVELRQRVTELEVLETEHKRAEQELQETCEYTESIVETVREPLVVLDADLRIVSANRSFYETFKVKPGETTGQLLYDLGNREWDIPKLRKLLEEIIPTSTTFDNFEVEHDFETIGRQVMHLNARRIYRETNETPLILLAIEHVTKRKRAEETLRKAHDELEQLVEEHTAELVKVKDELKQEIEERECLEKALVRKEKLKILGTISAEVAHEIRNPLVAIGGFAQRLQRKFPDSPECDIMLRETRRLEKMLDRIRNYLRPIEIRHQECSIATVITDCVDLLSPEMERRRVTCRLDLDPALPIVYVDPGILTQIFINLIRNAAEAMAKGGTLLIKTFESEKNIHIDFKNEAQGPKIMDSELLFLPFDEGGRSIGLPLCYRLVRKIGGILSFAPEQNFIVFSISLPKRVREDSDIRYVADPSDTLPEQIMRTEKRIYPRTEIMWPVSALTTRGTIRGETKNLTTQGAFIWCPKALCPNERFLLTVNGPSGSIQVIAQVIWSRICACDNERRPNGMGVKFIWSSTKHKQVAYWGDSASIRAINMANDDDPQFRRSLGFTKLATTNHFLWLSANWPFT